MTDSRMNTFDPVTKKFLLIIIPLLSLLFTEGFYFAIWGLIILEAYQEKSSVFSTIDDLYKSKLKTIHHSIDSRSINNDFVSTNDYHSPEFYKLIRDVDIIIFLTLYTLSISSYFLAVYLSKNNFDHYFFLCVALITILFSFFLKDKEQLIFDKKISFFY